MEATLLEKESQILNINSCKKHLLQQMLELEYNGLIDSKEYSTNFNFYKKLTSMLLEEVDNLDEKEKLMIISHLRRLNKETLKAISLKDLICKKGDEFVIAQRTILDLGAELEQLYTENRKEKLKRELVRVCSTYDIAMDMDEDLCVPDEELVNHYMVCDYTNVVYSQINDLLNSDIISDLGRFHLLKMKYNLIFVAPNIETRAIESAFYISDNPRLVDRHYIYDSGIKFGDYLSKLDNVMVTKLERELYTSLHLKSMKRGPIRLSDLVFIKTYASILSDTELLDYVEVDKTYANSNNYLRSVELIEDSFDKARIRSQKNYDLRKYTRI
ncbi:MAG: hypothetical protein E7159_04115 [Firmicutes bacterium]|nr:hypothetical protein [Bacillota bacterium]